MSGHEQQFSATSSLLKSANTATSSTYLGGPVTAGSAAADNIDVPVDLQIPASVELQSPDASISVYSGYSNGDNMRLINRKPHVSALICRYSIIGCGLVCCIVLYVIVPILLLSLAPRYGYFHPTNHNISDTTDPIKGLVLYNITLWEQHAAVLSKFSDDTVDPCVDFYQHVCGGWLSMTSIPTDESSVGQFDSLESVIDQQLISIVSDKWPIVGTWYDSCMTTASRISRSTAALSVMLEVVSDVTNDDQLASAVATLHYNGVSALFTTTVMPEERNPTVNAAYLLFPDISLGINIVLSNDTFSVIQRQALLDLMHVLIGNDNANRAMAMEQQYLAVMIARAEQFAGEQQQFNTIQYSVSVNTSLEFPMFNWHEYWIGTLGYDPGNVTVSVAMAWYLKALFGNAAIVASPLPLSTIEWHTVRAYLTYRLVSTYMWHYPNVSAVLSGFTRVVLGITAVPPLAEQCLHSTSMALGGILSHYYTDRYFPAENKAYATQLVENVLNAFAVRIGENQWMDDSTKHEAMHKLSAMRTLIAYPDLWSDDIPPYDILRDDYLGNVVRFYRSSVTSNWASLGWPADRYQWTMDSYTVNAYYDPEENDIVFPAGILQGPFFNPAAPDAANYGGVGVVVGHEITHGFDGEGRLYDATGAMQNWWTAQSLQAFDDRAQCLVNLYDGFAGISGLHVNGELTFAENLADFGGLAVAYDAYHRFLQTKSQEWQDEMEALVKKIYKMSSDQLLFRSWALSWCSKTTPELAYKLLEEDPHSPSRWRVNGPAYQSRSFTSAFECVNSASQQVCVVW